MKSLFSVPLEIQFPFHLSHYPKKLHEQSFPYVQLYLEDFDLLKSCLRNFSLISFTIEFRNLERTLIPFRF